MRFLNARVAVGSSPGISEVPAPPYDVSGDGRFLALVPVQPARVFDEITVVLNWHRELVERLPVE